MSTSEIAQRGRYIDTSDVMDAMYLLEDDGPDLVVVRAEGETPDLTSPDVGASFASKAVDDLYRYDPRHVQLDHEAASVVARKFTGIRMMDGGMHYGRSVNDRSGNHIDLGTDWPFVGPFACSWAIFGEAQFRAERLPGFLLGSKNGQYGLNPIGVGVRAFVKTARFGLDQPRTTVHQRQFDRVLFANHPWPTIHNVSLLSDARTARLYDYRLENLEPSRFNEMATRRARRRVKG